MKIIFIGAGEIGMAINEIINKKDFEIMMWDKDISKVPNQLSIEETVKGADVIFLCVPSKFVREAIRSFLNFLEKTTIVVSISKGLEIDSGKTIDLVLEQELPEKHAHALLSGPMLGEELYDGLMGAAVIASEDKNVLDILSNVFKGTHLKTETSVDMYSTALTGVLKNIYAIAFGAFDALHYGANSKGWLFSESLKEMRGMMEILKADPNRALSFSGIGDLVATGSSPYSCNFTLGYELACGNNPGFSCEGKISLPSVIAMLGDDFYTFPIAEAVMKIVIDGENAKDVFDQLIYG